MKSRYLLPNINQNPSKINPEIKKIFLNLNDKDKKYLYNSETGDSLNR